MIKKRFLLFAFLLSALTACSSGVGGDSSDNITETKKANIWGQMVWDEGTWQ